MLKQTLPMTTTFSQKPFTATEYGGKNNLNHKFNFWTLLLNYTHQCTEVFNCGLFASTGFDDFGNSSQNGQHLFMKR
jgi:hypothetical protein